MAWTRYVIAESFKIKQNVLDVTLHKIICWVWKDEVTPEQFYKPYLQK
jgi:hypothetical protein